MAVMAKENAKKFVLSIVPLGVGDYTWAADWCSFLNYVTDTEAYVPCLIEDKEHWASGQWFVST